MDIGVQEGKKRIGHDVVGRKTMSGSTGDVILQLQFRLSDTSHLNRVCLSQGLELKVIQTSICLSILAPKRQVTEL